MKASVAKPLDIAVGLLARGITPLPVPYREKGCVTPGWTTFSVTTATAPAHFNGAAGNVGMLLGEPSGGLVDVDLDQRLAVDLAPYFLPPTEFEYGRKSNPNSHRGYRCSDRWDTRTFDDPDAAMADDGRKAKIVELLGKDHQSLAPGSTHPSGERYEWVKDGQPAAEDYAKLEACVAALAAAVVVARSWVEGNREQLTVALTGTLLRAGWAAESIVKFLRPIAVVQRDEELGKRLAVVDSLDRAWQAKDGRRRVPGLPSLRKAGLSKAAVEAVLDWLGVNTAAPTRDVRVTVREGGLPEAVDETMAALVTHAVDANLYGRAGVLVRPHVVLRDGYDGDRVEALELVPVSLSSFRVDVSRMVAFDVQSHTKGGDVRASRKDCPKEIALAIYESPERVGLLPQIERIAETPIFDGKAISPAQGLHGTTWVHAPEGVALPAALTREAASAALARIGEWLAEFPFATPLDRAVGIALVMTAALRSSLVTAPGFIINKPTYGAGASTLAKLAGMVATGRAVAVMAFSRPVEAEKQLDAALLAARQVLVLDNLPEGETLSNDKLAQVLSETHVEVRELGKSRNHVVDCRRLVIGTGVGVGVGNDLMRRVLPCSLDPMLERPEERTFRRPGLLNELAASRVAVLSDVFTITAAYLAQDDRAACAPLAGYERWVAWVAAPLLWLGLPDVVAATRTSVASDPKSQSLRELLPLVEELQALDEFRRLGGVKVKHMIAEGDDVDQKTAGRGDRYWAVVAEIRRVLGEATGAKVYDGAPQLQPLHVAKWLQSVAKRPVGNKRLVSVGQHGGVALWCVEPVTTGGAA